MRKYWAYYRMCYKDEVAYKADVILHTAMDIVFFFIFLFLWRTIYSSAGLSEYNGYALTTTMTYYFATALIYRFDLPNSIYLNWDVWDGYFSNDLVKPWNIRITPIMVTLSSKTLSFLAYLPFMIFMMLAAQDYLALPGVTRILFFIVTLILSFLMNLFFNLILHSLVFYFGDQEANINLVNYLAGFLGGGVFPLAFLSPTVRPFFEALPFKYIFDTPASIFAGELTNGEIYRSWFAIVAWTIGFYLVFWIVFQNGLKRYTGTGR